MSYGIQVNLVLQEFRNLFAFLTDFRQYCFDINMSISLMFGKTRIVFHALKFPLHTIQLSYIIKFTKLFHLIQFLKKDNLNNKNIASANFWLLYVFLSHNQCLLVYIFCFYKTEKLIFGIISFKIEKWYHQCFLMFLVSRYLSE